MVRLAHDGPRDVVFNVQEDRVDELRALAGNSGSALDAAIDEFEKRNGFLAVHGVDVGRIHFATAFGRGLD